MRPFQRKWMQHDWSHVYLYGIILFIVCSVSWMPSGYGQPLLGLDEALKIGLENNFGIRIARNESVIAANNNTPGNAGILPEIFLSGSYQKSVTNADVRVVSGMELDNDAAPTEWMDAGIFLNWTLFDGLNMFVNRERLQTLQEMGEMAFGMSAEQAMTRVIIIYADIVRHQMMLKVLQDQVELSRERALIAETRKTIGSASALEFLQAQVDLNADESALMQQMAVLANSKILLNEVLARDITLTFLVADTILLKDQLDLTTLKRNSLSDNSGLLMEKYNWELDQLNLKSMKGVRYPVVSFSSSYSYMEDETEASFIEYNRQIGPYFGLSLDFTLFDGLNRSREVQNARINIENAELQLEEYQQKLESEVNRHYNQYESELDIIELERQNLILAEKNMDIATESYRIGAISSIELREVQENLLDAHSRMITALFRVKARETELLRLSGELFIPEYSLPKTE